MSQAGQIPIREDSRTFREFYPDASLRGQVHYAFAHRFLPQYVQQSPYAFLKAVIGPKAMDPTRYLQARWGLFEQQVGLVEPPRDIFSGMVFRRVTDLTMSIVSEAATQVALIQMPLPEGPVQAYFVAVVPGGRLPPEQWDNALQARVFTLESMLDVAREPGGKAVLCEWAGGSHCNLGRVLPATPEAFLLALQDVLKSDPTRSPESSS